MKTKIVSIVFSGMLGVTLVGCAGPGRYAPEPSLTRETGATLYGSREHDPNPLAKDARTFVVAVDGKRTGTIPYEWDQPLLVSAGPHAIQIATRYDRMGGSVTTQLTLERGKSYVVRADALDRGNHPIAWVEEQGSGRTVGEKMAMCLDNDAPIVQLLSPCR
jgi:hypothetical protein